MVETFALVFEGTEDAGVFFHECELGTMLPDHWNIEHGLQQRPGRADVTVEVHSDSNWGSQLRVRALRFVDA